MPRQALVQVRARSTANYDLATNPPAVFDGVNFGQWDVAWLSEQTAPSQNGFYQLVSVAPRTWQRLADVEALIPFGVNVRVAEGAVYGGRSFKWQS
jgi:hypothetical protein